MTVKLSHERKVRSLAKKTLGSTRVGRAMRLPVGIAVSHRSQKLARVLCRYLPGAVWSRGWLDMAVFTASVLVACS